MVDLGKTTGNRSACGADLHPGPFHLSWTAILSCCKSSPTQVQRRRSEVFHGEEKGDIGRRACRSRASTRTRSSAASNGFVT